jgi:hypothetical protein
MIPDLGRGNVGDVAAAFSAEAGGSFTAQSGMLNRKSK